MVETKAILLTIEDKEVSDAKKRKKLKNPNTDDHILARRVRQQKTRRRTRKRGILGIAATTRSA